MTRAGDVLFFRGKTFISRLIRWVTGSEYTHVALAIGNGEIVESDRFVNTRIRKLTEDDDFDIYRVEELKGGDRRLIRSVAMSFDGYPYDYLQIAGILFRAVFGTERTFFNRSNRFICSELIDITYAASFIPRDSTRPVGDVTPHELLIAYNFRLQASEEPGREEVATVVE